MYRGGNWNNGANAGVFYLNGNNARSNSNTNIGFRPALASFVTICGLRLSRNMRQKGRISRPTRPKKNARVVLVETPERQPAGGGHRGQRANRAGWPILRKQVKDCRRSAVWRPQTTGCTEDCHTRAIFFLKFKEGAAI